VINDRFEQRAQVGRIVLRVTLGDAVARDAVEDREVELVLGCVEIDKQVVDLVKDLGDTGVVTVDLVD
jgi:hypothetical protein